MRLLLSTLTALAVFLAFPFAASAKTVKKVKVTNFPDPQYVVGAVEVTNLPDVQDVSIVDGAASSCEVNRFQLVGFTTAMLPGTEGPLAFTGACDTEFLSSRWCTSAEVLDSVNLPALSGEAWVRAAFVGVTGGGNPVDVTGWTLVNSTFTCGFWSNPAGNGFTVSATGKFAPMPCGVSRPIACCAPAP